MTKLLFILTVLYLVDHVLLMIKLDVRLVIMTWLYLELIIELCFLIINVYLNVQMDNILLIMGLLSIVTLATTHAYGVQLELISVQIAKIIFILIIKLVFLHVLTELIRQLKVELECVKIVSHHVKPVQDPLQIVLDVLLISSKILMEHVFLTVLQVILFTIQKFKKIQKIYFIKSHIHLLI